MTRYEFLMIVDSPEVNPEGGWQLCRYRSHLSSQHVSIPYPRQPPRKDSSHVHELPSQGGTVFRPSTYSTKSSIVHTLNPHFCPNRKQPSLLIIPPPFLRATPSTSSPSSTISPMTPAGCFEASRQNSTAASVCPLRSSIPPSLARRGMICPGRRNDSGVEVGEANKRQVRARSWAEIPVVIAGSAPSMEMVYAVRFGSVFSRTIWGSDSAAHFEGGMGAQT